MKFFGWGRKKLPPPIQPTHNDSKNSDAARITHIPGTAEYGSELAGQKDRPQTPPQREALPAPPSKDFVGEARVAGSETWEERLHETIRFVFSHEQQGLLAIGTFALDQLAGVHHLDSQEKPPPPDHHPNSRRNSVSSVQVVPREVQSSDDETESQHSLRSSIPARKRNSESYPVFGDHGASSQPHCRALSVGNTKPIALNHTTKDHPSCTNSPNANTDIKRGEDHPEVKIPSPTDHDGQSDDDFYSPGICGLFESRSRRTQRGVKEKRKKPPENRKGELKRADSKESLGCPLGQLWRTGCNSSVSAKVTPEKKLPCPSAETEAQPQGPPCIANVEDGGAAGLPKPSQPSQNPEIGEQRRRRGHNFGKGWACAHNGKWIRTDSEFVVLEM